MQYFRVIIALLIGRLACLLVRLFHIGYGSTLPGSLARTIFPDILKYLSAQIKGEIIYITGTNGKTTTLHFLATLMEQKDLVYNGTGANLEAGLISSLIKKSSYLGKVKAVKAIFEVDEKILPSVLQKTVPHLLICLNLFRDQMDRHGEMESTKNAWAAAIAKLPAATKLLFNGDDPLLVGLSKQLQRHVYFFGVNQEQHVPSALPHALDSIHCPFCMKSLAYTSMFLAHLGDYCCHSCDFKRGLCMIDSMRWQHLFPQIHNKYNAVAAVCGALLSGKREDEIHNNMQKLILPFGREERIKWKGVDILLLLSKNPVSLNISISLLKNLKSQGELGSILIALNDEPADGKDISWIWDAEMSELCELAEAFYCTGSRAHEMALCLNSFATHENDKKAPSLLVDPHFPSLVKLAINHMPSNKTLCVLATYTALLSIRSTLLGKKDLC